MTRVADRLRLRAPHHCVLRRSSPYRRSRVPSHPVRTVPPAAQLYTRSLTAPCLFYCLTVVDRVRFLLLYPSPRPRASPLLCTLFVDRRRRLSATPATSLRRPSRSAPRQYPARRAIPGRLASSAVRATQIRRGNAVCAPRWSRRPCLRRWSLNLNPHSRLSPTDDADPTRAATLAARAPNRCHRRAPPPARHSIYAARCARRHLLALGVGWFQPRRRMSAGVGRLTRTCRRRFRLAPASANACASPRPLHGPTASSVRNGSCEQSRAP